MKTKEFRGTAVYCVEVDSLEDAQEVSADTGFLKSLAESDVVKIEEIKCVGVAETGDPGFYELTCNLSGTAGDDVDLKKFGIDVVE